MPSSLHLFFFFLLSQLSCGLLLNVAQHSLTLNGTNHFYNITTVNLHSIYTTLGNAPTSPIVSPLIVVSLDSIDGDLCTCARNVSGRAVLFNGTVPLMRGCNRYRVGSAAALVRMMEKQGAIAVILPAQEYYMEGRMLGRATDISIPVLVSPISVISFIASNFKLVANVEVSAITHSELATITRLNCIYTTLLIFLMSLYSALLVLLTAITVMDTERLFRKRRWFSHGSILRFSALASTLGCFLWLVLDPFGFRGFTWWYPNIAFSIHQAFYLVSMLSVVRMWMMASTSVISCIQNPKIISYVIYLVALLDVLSGLGCGIYWWSIGAAQSFVIISFTGMILSGIAFIIFGKMFMLTFVASKNAGPSSQVLPRKIAIFILLYIAFTIVTAVVFFSGAIGAIFGHFFSSLYVAVAYFTLFLLLFIPKMEHKQKKSRSATFVEMSKRRTKKPTPTEPSTQTESA